VAGDFVMQVRLRTPVGGDGRAGLMLASGRDLATVDVSVPLANGEGTCHVSSFLDTPSVGRASSHALAPRLRGNHVWLRLERKGQNLTGAYSLDGKEWGWLATDQPFYQGEPSSLPVAVMVGVFAEWPTGGLQENQRRAYAGGLGVEAKATAGGTFQATFDEFKLTPLAGKAP
jgi:regulation of enolase protein 1 (concanavalin A-like superfamily)